MSDIITHENQDSFAGAWHDMLDGISRWRFWLSYGLRDLSGSFPGAWSGVIFIPLQTAIIVAAFWLIFHDTLGASLSSYAGYVALGYPLFVFLMGSVTSTKSAIRQNANILANMPFPVFAFVMRAVVRLTATLFLSLSVFLLLVIAGQIQITLSFAAGLAGLMMLIAIVIANTLAFSLISLYLPNAIAILNSFTRFALFITPVLWVPDGSRFRMIIATYNPLTHLIAIVRDPFLFGTVPGISWAVAAAILLVMSVAGMVLMKHVRRYIIFRI